MNVSDIKDRDLEILKELRRIYDFEFQRFKILDEKAMHVATSTGTILALFIGLVTLTLEHIKEMECNLLVLDILFILVVSSFFLFSMINSLRTIKTKKFFTTDSRILVEEYSKRDFSEYLEHFRKDLLYNNEQNSDMNKEKADMLNNSIIALCIGSFALVIYILSLIIVLSQ